MGPIQPRELPTNLQLARQSTESNTSGRSFTSVRSNLSSRGTDTFVEAPSAAPLPAAPTAPAADPTPAAPNSVNPAWRALRSGFGIPAAARAAFGWGPVVGTVALADVATVIGCIATRGNPNWLSWGNTAFATYQNFEIPTALNIVHAQTKQVEKALRGDPANPNVAEEAIQSPELRPGFTTEWSLLQPVRTGFGAINTLMRPLWKGVETVVATDLGTLTAQSLLVALWIDRLVILGRNDDAGALQSAVNAIPQYVSTAYTALILYAAKRQMDRLRRLDKELHANNDLLAARPGTETLALPAPQRAPSLSQKAINELINITGNETNLAAYTISCGVCLGLAAQLGIGNNFAAVSNAILAAVQFPDIMFTKALSTEDKHLSQRLQTNLPALSSNAGLTLEAAPAAAQQGAVAQAASTAGNIVDRSVDAVSSFLGHPFIAANAATTGVAILCLVRTGVGNDTWLSIFNGLMQAVATPALDMAIFDWRRSASRRPNLNQLDGVLRAQRARLNPV